MQEPGIHSTLNVDVDKGKDFSDAGLAKSTQWIATL